MAKDENFHGYRWSDGSVRQHPEPKQVVTPKGNAHTYTELPKPVVVRPPTPEQYAVAYAAWLKEFNEWRAKYGTR